MDAEGCEQWPGVRPSHLISTTTLKRETKLPSFTALPPIAVVAAPCCSQADTDLRAVIKFLSCQGFYDSSWPIKPNIITLNFTTGAMLLEDLLDFFFLPLRYLGRGEDE